MKLSIWILATANHLIEMLREDATINFVIRQGNEYQIQITTQEFLTIIERYSQAPGVTSILLRT